IYEQNVLKNETLTLTKFGGYTVDRNHNKNILAEVASKTLAAATNIGFDELLQRQVAAWSKIWEMADITIEGDVKAQQGIRFNIFQLNQTYLGKDARLNIGPKG